MPQPQDFTIKVPSEDPKKKEKPDEPDKVDGASKPPKDGKEGDAEELVSALTS